MPKKDKPGIILFKFIGTNNYKNIKKQELEGKTHPLYAMISTLRKGLQPTSEIYIKGATLEEAIKCINTKQEYSDFLKQKLTKSCLLSSDISSIYAAIAEILCLYDFLRTDFSIINIPTKPNTKTPDFKIISTNEEVAYVEVNCKNFDEINNTKCINECTYEIEKDGKIYVLKNSIKTVSPFGFPIETKKENSVLQGIQKICQIKNTSAQAVDKYPFILYIDVDSGNMSSFSDFLKETSIFSFKHNHICSNIVWYALYGKKGLSVFENIPFHMLNNMIKATQGNNKQSDKDCIPFDKLICRMQHHGKFKTDKKISAIIFRFQNLKYICENPNAQNPLSQNMRLNLLKLHNIDINRCIFDLYPGMIKQINNNNKRLLETIWK